MSFETNKPDSNPFLGSPVSPLLPTTTSSSGNSSATRRRSQSGELSGSSDGSTTSSSLPRHRRSGSGALPYSAATSQAANVIPAGNICPSGKLAKTGVTLRPAARPDVLGSGTGNYGHGSIMRGGAASAATAAADGPVGRGKVSCDPEEVTRAGNEQYKRGQFAEALRFYDQAAAMCGGNAACRSNRAAALTGLGRVGDAVKECEAAIRLDPAYARAHQRLASLLLRLGQVENARRYLELAGRHRDPAELQKLQLVEWHLGRCEDARKVRDWKSALREADDTIAAGADSSPLLIALRAEALLRLKQLEEADSTLLNAPKLETISSSSSQARFFGMLSDSYVSVVRAQVEMAFGRFDNAVKAAEKARKIDPGNGEVTATLHNVRSVAKARTRGNEIFKSGNFIDACTAYGEGLKYDPSNPVLHCNRAACYSKLGQWERSVEDCNEALRTHPSYTKALLRRASSNAKLERWAESVRDYELLKKELPGDTEVAEALFHAQVSLKTFRGQEVSIVKFGGEVKQITGWKQFKAAVSLPKTGASNRKPIGNRWRGPGTYIEDGMARNIRCEFDLNTPPHVWRTSFETKPVDKLYCAASRVSVVYFMDEWDPHCTKMTQFVGSLCSKYPSLNFLKVNIKESLDVAKDENVLAVPTFKIYKNRGKVKEMIRPSQQMLEYLVRHYST